MKNIKKDTITGTFLLLLIFVTSFLPPVYAVEEQYDCASGKHKYNITLKEPTATADGEKLLVCELCGYRYTQILPATEHYFGSWIIDRQPTCTADGEKHRTCTATAIPHREIQSIPATGHSYDVITKAPDCINAGVKTYTCKNCPHTYTETLGQAQGHNYREEIALLPTYDKEGIRIYTCRHCGSSYTQPVPKVTEHEHQYKVFSEAKADCEKNGHITHVCDICGEKYTDIINAYGHDYGEWLLDKPVSLFSSGYRRQVCKNNSSHTISEDIPGLVTMELNTTDAVMAPLNISFILFFILTLISDLYVILWDLKKRNKTKKIQKMKRRYAACAAAVVVFIIALPMLLKLLIFNISYMNLLAFTAVLTIVPIGIFMRVYSNIRRTALNGHGGVYEQGAQKGQLVSRNKI